MNIFYKVRKVLKLLFTKVKVLKSTSLKVKVKESSCVKVKGLKVKDDVFLMRIPTRRSGAEAPAHVH